eukprot:6066230-Lingulodinium_polyedra.AAC.1
MDAATTRAERNKWRAENATDMCGHGGGPSTARAGDACGTPNSNDGPGARLKTAQWLTDGG